MIKVIRACERHFTDFGWLKTYWLFSFSNYYDHGNIQFGALRVFNDDVVEPGTGFPTHSHHEMEIITIVLEGAVTHKDSMGNEAVIEAGEVQRMSAGTGLTHSEYNLNDRPAHFYQIWLFPDRQGLKPTYDQRSFDPASWKNRLIPVASGEGLPDVVTFHTAATLYRADIDPGRRIEYGIKDNRKVFLYLTSGSLELNGVEMNQKDQARIDLEDSLDIQTARGAGFILIDVPSCKGFGYDRATLQGGKA